MADQVPQQIQQGPGNNEIPQFQQAPQQQPEMFFQQQGPPQNLQMPGGGGGGPVCGPRACDGKFVSWGCGPSAFDDKGELTEEARKSMQDAVHKVCSDRRQMMDIERNYDAVAKKAHAGKSFQERFEVFSASCMFHWRDPADKI